MWKFKQKRQGVLCAYVCANFVCFTIFIEILEPKNSEKKKETKKSRKNTMFKWTVSLLETITEYIDGNWIGEHKNMSVLLLLRTNPVSVWPCNNEIQSHELNMIDKGSLGLLVFRTNLFVYSYYNYHTSHVIALYIYF